MPDITRPEDDDSAREESRKLKNIALDHALSWRKHHADQRIALIRFYIIALGGVAVAWGWVNQRHEYIFSTIISIFGAVLAFCFLRLDQRTSDLVKVREDALKPEQERMAAATGNDAMRLCLSADKKRETTLIVTVRSSVSCWARRPCFFF